MQLLLFLRGERLGDLKLVEMLVEWYWEKLSWEHGYSVYYRPQMSHFKCVVIWTLPSFVTSCISHLRAIIFTKERQQYCLLWKLSDAGCTRSLLCGRLCKVSFVELLLDQTAIELRAVLWSGPADMGRNWALWAPSLDVTLFTKNTHLITGQFSIGPR